MAVLPKDTGDYPSAGIPFCVHDNDLWLLSGATPNPDGTVTRDLLAYTGYRVERVARIPAAASPSSIGLLTWRGELLYYELTASSAAFKLLVGNHFVDFLSPTFSASGMTPIAASCGGEIILTGKSGANEGIYHAGGSALQDGSLETSWHDGDRPGVEKRLLNITATVKGATSNTNVTIKYQAGDSGAYTQAATSTGADSRVTASDLSVSFYRLKLKIELSDTSPTADVRLTGLSFTYAAGEE